MTVDSGTRPRAVVSVGGYASAPAAVAAVLLRVPLVIAESNAVPGFTNRRLARFVDAAAVSFAAALPYFHGKGILTGNPVRSEFFDIPAKTRDPQRFRLLLFGGSQGARAINEAMVEALPHLQTYREKMQITHQTGKLDFDKVVAGYDAAGWRQVDVREYIDDMVGSFAENDLIVSRAGATTSFELMAAGKPALMVPLPGQLEQQRNAEVLEQAGAARMIMQNELNGQRLAQEIGDLIDRPEEITRMEVAGRKLARRDAASASVDMMERLIERRAR